MEFPKPKQAPRGDRMDVAVGMRVILDGWLDAIHRLNVAPAGCPAANAALRDLERLEHEWQLAVG